VSEDTDFRLIQAKLVGAKTKAEERLALLNRTIRELGREAARTGNYTSPDKWSALQDERAELVAESKTLDRKLRSLKERFRREHEEQRQAKETDERYCPNCNCSVPFSLR
jgi:predicted  nucleic acid-binding Zn-ribbon protein